MLFCNVSSLHLTCTSYKFWSENYWTGISKWYMVSVVVCCGNAIEMRFIISSWTHSCLKSCFIALFPARGPSLRLFVSLMNSAVISGSQCWPTVSMQACCSQRKNRQMPLVFILLHMSTFHQSILVCYAVEVFLCCEKSCSDYEVQGQ